MVHKHWLPVCYCGGWEHLSCLATLLLPQASRAPGSPATSWASPPSPTCWLLPAWLRHLGQERGLVREWGQPLWAWQHLRVPQPGEDEVEGLTLTEIGAWGESGQIGSLMTTWVTGRDQVLNLLSIHPLLHIRESLGTISSCFWFNFKRKPCWQNLKITGWYLPHCLNGRYTRLRTHHFLCPSAPKQVQFYPRLQSCASAETAETVWKHCDTQRRTNIVKEGFGLISSPVLKLLAILSIV